MTDREPQPGQVDPISQAKEKARREIAEAKQQGEAEKQALARRILNRLRQSKTAAREAVEAAQRTPSGLIPEEAKSSAIRAVKSAVETLEAVKESLITPPPKSQAVLTHLAEKGLTETVTAHLYPLIERYTREEISFSQEGQPLTQFEQDFQQLKSANPLAADLLRDSLIEAAREGKLGRISGEELREKFKLEREEQVKEQREGERPSGRESQTEQLRMTEAEERRLKELEKKIKESGLSYKEREKLFNNMIRGINRSEVESQLRQAGLSEREIDELIRLVEKANKVFEPYVEAEKRSLFRRHEERVFSYEFLVDNGYIQDGKLTPEGKRLLKKTALRALNRLLEKVDESPDRLFNENYSELYEGRTFRVLQDVIMDLIKDKSVVFSLYGGNKNDQRYQEMLRFLREGVLQEISRERELRELYHNIGIWIKTVTPEDLAKFVSKYDVSLMTSQVNNDVSGKLVDLALSEYERYLQTDIALNNNQVRPSLYSSKVDSNLLAYTNEDRERLKRRFKRKLESLKGYRLEDSDRARHDLIQRYDQESIEEYEDWEIDRALKYARGISLITTIRGFEILASANPPSHFRGSADNLYDMVAFLNPRWKWRLGRGGDYIMHIPEIFFLEASRKPERSLLKRIFTKGWDPKEFHNQSQKWAQLQKAKQWEKIENEWLQRNSEFKKLMRLFGLGGLASRAGWRTEGIGETYQGFQGMIKSLEEEVEKKAGIKMSSDWEKAYNWLSNYVGVGARFFFDAGRAADFGKNFLYRVKDLEAKIRAGEISEEKLEHLYHQYFEGEKNGEIVYQSADGEKFNLFQLIEARTHMYRGENFYALLRRSPADFLNNLLQLTPELLTEDLGGVPDYYFEFDEKRLKSVLRASLKGEKIKDFSTEFDKVRAFQSRLVYIWGKENLGHLIKVRSFYKKVEDWGRSEGYTKNGKLDKDRLFEEFYHQLTLAFEKARLRNEAAIKPSDIENGNLAKLFFGREGPEKDWGLIDYFEKNKDQFGDDKELDFGQKGFFYHMGRAWYTEMGHSLHPNTADLDWRFVFNNLGEYAGENVVKRLWGDIKGWNETIHDLSRLDHILKEVGESGDISPIMKLHKNIHALEGWMGTALSQEANYYLATIVARYFQEHYASRIPFPFGTLFGLANRRTISLSRIHGGPGALTWTTDGINAYFQQLMYNGWIAKEGQFSFDNLAKSLGADWRKLVTTEIIPNLAIALFLFLLYKYISESLKEAEGKKQ